MRPTGGDFIIERLHARGARRADGYPGDGINGVFGGTRPRSICGAKLRT
ncbi:hypothetical protein LMG28140_05413 [Paraburkholderia metrosideri]|jgi:pyruvate dehydrogenase (quinone)|uniref:Uncharacterized protein n=1 Tax=Paraburkholderia metrosideri TaxID=580937 RepID=A0ABM8P205_9BURK|nr:hypothetical protein LMG28140_05413 [Paraburkholderia metrosideri]